MWWSQNHHWIPDVPGWRLYIQNINMNKHKEVLEVLNNMMHTPQYIYSQGRPTDKASCYNNQSKLQQAHFGSASLLPDFYWTRDTVGVAKKADHTHDWACDQTETTPIGNYVSGSLPACNFENMKIWEMHGKRPHQIFENTDFRFMLWATTNMLSFNCLSDIICFLLMKISKKCGKCTYDRYTLIEQSVDYKILRVEIL